MQHDRHEGFALVPMRLEPTDGSWSGTLFADQPGDAVSLALPLSDTLLALWGRREVDEICTRLIAAVDLT